MCAKNYATVERNARLRKGLLIAKLAVTRPGEFVDRLQTAVEARLNRLLKPADPVEADRKDAAWTCLRCLAAEDLLARFRDEARTTEDEARRRLTDLVGPFAESHNADMSLARACYAACRVLRPAVVIETGVAYGVTTLFLLRALEANEAGELHSIDLPPLAHGADAFVGTLVPAELRSRWKLHRGVSRRVLPAALGALQAPVGVFVHDSLHTYWNVRNELKCVERWLSRPAAVFVDDVQWNRAFADWTSQANPACWCVVREESKPSAFGMALLL